MTISNTKTKVIVQGNGAQTVFSYDFLLPFNGSTLLFYEDTAGVLTPINPNAYTISGIGNPNGGHFTYPIGGGSPIAAGTSLTLARTTAETQPTDFANQNSYNPQVLEQALDWITLLVQQNGEAVGRAIAFPPSEDPYPLLPTAPLRANTTLGFDGNGNLTLRAPGGGGGGGGSLPVNAPLIGTDSTGAAQTVLLGLGLSLNDGTLTSVAAQLPANAPLLATDSESNAVGVQLGTGISIVNGTLQAASAVVPSNAAVLSSVGTTLTALALGAGLISSGGTLAAVGLSPPANAQLLAADSMGNFYALSVGIGLLQDGMQLRAVRPASAALLNSNAAQQEKPVTLGAGLSLVGTLVGGGGGTLVCTVNTPPFNAPILSTDGSGTLLRTNLGAGLTLSAGTLSASAAIVPPNAALLASDSGGNLTAVVVGTGLAESAGTLTATSATVPANAAVLSSVGTILTALSLGAGLASSGGTLSASAAGGPANSPLVGVNSGGTFTTVSAGSGISISGGTLSATAASIPPSAALLGSNSGSTLTSISLGSGLSESGGTLSATASIPPPISAALLSTNSGGTFVATSIGADLTISGGTLSLLGPTTSPVVGTDSSGHLTAITLGSGLALSAGTLTATAGIPLPNSAQLLGSNSGGTATAVVVGANLTLSSGTLTATGGGGGSFIPGPIDGITAFVRDALSTFTTSVIGAEAAVYTDYGSGKPIQVQQAGANANGWDYRVKATPSLPYTITALAEFNPYMPPFVVAAPIILVDSGGKFIAFGVTGSAVGIDFSYWNSPTSFDTNNTIGVSNTFPATMWVQVVVDATHITGFLSSNGINWSQVFQVGLTSFLGSAPVAMGFGMNADSSGPGAIGFDMSLWNWVQT